MRLIFKAPDKRGLVHTRGTRLFTPDGSEVTGVQDIQINVDREFVITTVHLIGVLVEYEKAS